MKPTDLATIPPDALKRNPALAQPGNNRSLPHIGLVGDTYTITITGEDTGGRFCVIDMYIQGAGPDRIGKRARPGAGAMPRSAY
ncbi:MAG: hypothetical protein M3Z36_02685 [Acidobacteriota bacterium]|nr:hypothetical protein [Acidobacteriota bacterium]